MPRNSGVTARVREFFLRTRDEHTIGEIAQLMHAPYKQVTALLSGMYSAGELRRRAGGIHPANHRTVWLYAPVRGALAAPAERTTAASGKLDARALCGIMGTVYRGEPPHGRVHRMDDHTPVGQMRPLRETRR